MKSLVSFPRYEGYKDSGVDSIGKIPKHWGIVRFRNFFKFNRGLSITKENLRDEGIPCVSYGEIHSRFGFEVNPQKHDLKCVSSDYLLKNKSSLIHQGDIIYADTSEDIEGSGNFTQLVTDDDVFAGYHTIVCRPIEEVNHRYIAYCLESLSFRKQIRKEVKGVKVFSITQAILKNTSIWLPFSEEQNLIATYLDQKTTQIDQAIDIKKKQIELLKERQQVLIQQAVTKGLDPAVRMRDSGVEWIGEVPEHWVCTKVKRVLAMPITDGPHSTPVFLDDGIPFISAEAIKDGKINFEKKRGYISRQDYETFSKKYKPKIYDVYMIKSGATTGRVAMVETSKEFTIWSPLAVFRSKKEILNSIYLYYFLQSFSFIKGVELSWSFGTQQNIGMGVLGNLSIVFPPLHEQNLIVESLKPKLDDLEKLEFQLLAQIEKLQEYKSSLINSAVTGKIKITPDMIAVEE